MEFLYPGVLIAMIFVCVWYVVDRRNDINKNEETNENEN
jgi:TRAP-type C4-dicarboxylate transport system permease large subunit